MAERINSSAAARKGRAVREGHINFHSPAALRDSSAARPDRMAAAFSPFHANHSTAPVRARSPAEMRRTKARPAQRPSSAALSICPLK